MHPIRVKDGLPYASLRPYTDTEWETLPHVIWTRDSDWDPSIFDHEFDEDGDEWYGALMDHVENPHRELFEEFGKRELVSASIKSSRTLGRMVGLLPATNH